MTPADKLRAFVREQAPGQCKLLSRGDACDCPLCCIDALSARPEVGASAERDRHIEGFRDLNANWDSYGAEKMNEATIQLGLKISKTLGAEWKVVPCADGPSVWFYRGDEEEIIQAWSSSPQNT